MEECINKKCMYYDKDEILGNNCLNEADIKICPNHLIAKTDPVAEVPCSDRVMTEATCSKCKRILENNWGDICGDCLKNDN